ncbi:uncharacterized protein LOC119074466 [Bradysia coprophila]|uniref:uncharacterized protein LOC119074466 n=1 Tax=Bradysia coprophila TaxID=38358 RepID=UPI00187D799D|nr:uncharacterized protein LOC119074466 [Bradysia coprophila]
MEFGELNITASRAFWDDYENIDGDQPVEPIRIELKWLEDHSIEDFKNVKTFITLEGERMRNRISQDAVVPICQLQHQKVFIYMSREKETAICISEETNLNTFGTIGESIADLINSSAVEDVNVVTVNTLPISSYKIGTNERLGGGVTIRGISSGKPLAAVPELMEPNILTGVSAAVASHRHHLNKPFSSYAIYMDSTKTRFEATPAITSFIHSIGLASNIFHEGHPMDESGLYT